MKLITWFMGLSGVVLLLICFILGSSHKQIDTPIILPMPKPADLTCVGTDGHYKPANGMNRVVLNDSWCK